MGEGKGNVTGVLIIHNDTSMLEATLASAKPFIDRLVVVDGAYRWVAPFCKMNGEDPERSTDDLLKIVKSLNLPYKYLTGVWENETHKRTVAFEASDTDKIMRIDADEIYEIDVAALDRFWKSDNAVGSLWAPLFTHGDVITWNAHTKVMPRAPIFFNLRNASVSDILDSMWLIRPEDEVRTVDVKAKVDHTPLGIFYHLTALRPANDSYRRARFYSLLSMRMSKRVNFGLNRSVNNDIELLDAVASLDAGALDTAFRMHRIAASFPDLRVNQVLKEFFIEDEVKKSTVADFWRKMLISQREKGAYIFGHGFSAFGSRSYFFDVSDLLNARYDKLIVSVSDKIPVKTTMHVDCGASRYVLNGAEKELSLLELSESGGVKRILAEVIIGGKDSEIYSVDFDLR